MTFLLGLADIVQPDTVTGITCSLTHENSVRVMWKPVNDITLSHYEVHRSTDDDTYSMISKVVSPFVQYLDRQLATGTYFYKIYAIDKNKYSSCAPTATGILLGTREPFATTTVVTNGQSKTYDLVSFFNKKAHSVTAMRHGGGTIIVSYSADGTTFPSSERMQDRGSLEKSDRRLGMQIQAIKITGSGPDTSFTVEAA